MHKIFSLITHGNVSPDFYIRNLKQLRERNTRMLKIALGFSAVINLGLLITTHVVPILFVMRGFYYFFSAWSILWAILAFTVLPRHTVLAKGFYAVFAGTVLTMTALAGSYYSQELCAVTYLVFLIFVPGLYVNRPTCCITTTILAGTIFCFMTAYFKSDPYIISVDIINTIFSMVVGIAFNLYSINLQLENLQSSITLSEQSTTDELTALPNRRCFNMNIGPLFDQRQQNQMVIYMMDVDYFKKYNDALGHLKGDECLALVGKGLMQTALEWGVFVARYGGEEFVAVDNSHGEDQAEAIAKAFLESVRSLNIAHPYSTSGRVTISVGYAACSSSQAKSYMQLIDFADEALYSAKHHGRNTCRAYVSSIHQEQAPTIVG